MVRIYQRGKKRTYWIDYIYESERVRETLSVTSKLAAEKRLVEARAALARGERPFMGRKTKLGELLDDYIVWCVDVCLNGPKTLRDKKRYIGRYLKFWRPDKNIGNITRIDIDTYKGRRYKESNSRILANREFQTLRHFFNFVKDRGIIGKSPCAGVKKFRGEELHRKPRHRLDQRIIRYWLNYCKQHDELLFDLSVIAIFTGQRAGDILRIRGTDIQGDIWYVRQTKKLGKMIPFPLHDFRVRVVLSKRRRLYGDNYLFPGRKPGTHLTTYRRRFEQALGKFGFGKAFCFADFRNNFATMLAETGTSGPVIKKLMGHSRLSTTEQYIREISDSAKEQALDRLAKHLPEE